MSKSTFKILFYIRKNQVNKEGTVCIMVRLTYKRQNDLRSYHKSI